MPQSHHASPDDIDITEVFRAVWRNAFKLITIAGLTGVLVYGLVSMVAPRYESEAALEVLARDASNPFLDPRADGARSDTLAVRMDQQAVNTHVRAIQSSEIAATIAADLQLERLAEFNSAIGPVDAMDGVLRLFGIGGPRPGESREDRVLDAYYRKLTVSSPKDSRVIAISFQSHDPQLAADIANKLAETYRKRLASKSVVETGDLQKALAPKIETLMGEVAKAATEVRNFRVKAGLLQGGTQKTPLNDQQLGDLTTELTKVSAARSAADARANNARQLMRRGTPEVIPEVQRSPLIQNLIQQKVQVQRDLLKFSASMKSAHPVIKQLDADLMAIRRQIGNEVANIVAGLEKDAIVAAEQEGSIRASLDKVKSRVADSGDDQVKLQQLEAQAQTKRAELERLRSQFEANRARADKGVVPVEARIITNARPSGVPVAPKKGAWAALSAVAALLLGLVVVITRALFVGARSNRQQAASLQQPSGVDRIEPAAASMTASAAAAPPEPTPSELAAQRLGLGRPKLEQDAISAAETMDQQASQNASKANQAAPPVGRSRRAETALTSAGELADHLSSAATLTEAGFRTLVSSDIASSLACEEALRTALALEERGAQVLIVDWDLEGKGIAGELGIDRRPGFTELFQGAASFGDVVRLIPGTRIQAIAAGAAFAEGATGLDAEQLNLILDALDEAYDQIIIVAQRPHARSLFEAIQGRFDAGVTLAGSTNQLDDPSGTFLGFEVTDIELIKFQVSLQRRDRITRQRPTTGPIPKAAAV